MIQLSFLKKILIVFLVFSIHPVFASNWIVTNGVGAIFQFNDNASMSSNDEVDVLTTIINLSSDAETRVGSTEAFLNFNANFIDYDELYSNQNTFALNASLNQSKVRSNINIGFGYELQSTLETELVDSGIYIDSERELISLSPSFTYEVSPTSSLMLGLNMQTTDYDSDSFVDSDRNRLEGSWNKSISEPSAVFVGVNLTEYMPDSGSDTSITGLNLGYAYVVDEMNNLRFSIGVSESTESGVDESSETFELAWNRVLSQRSDINVSLSRSLDNSSTGEIAQTDRIVANYRMSNSVKLQSTLGLVFYSNNIRDYYSIQPGVSYAYTQYTNMSAFYSYRNQKENNETASANVLNFALTVVFI